MVKPLPTPQQGAALVWEITDAAVNLGHGLRILRSADFRSLDAGAVFSLLAMGAEKLLKLSRGALGLAEKSKWPDDVKSYNHGVHVLNAEMVAAITKRKDLSTVSAPGLVDELLQQVGQDRRLDALLAALERYGEKGRFHHLDLLAGKMLSKPSPANMWKDLEADVMRTDPVAAAATSPDSYQEGRERINAVLAESVDRWMWLYYRAWGTGVLGKQAKPWAVGFRAELNRLETPGW